MPSVWAFRRGQALLWPEVGDGENAMTGANPMIQAALDAGQDASGLCTVRELAGYLSELNQRECELYFERNGQRLNAEIAVTAVDGVATAPPPASAAPALGARSSDHSAAASAP